MSKRLRSPSPDIKTPPPKARKLQVVRDSMYPVEKTGQTPSPSVKKFQPPTPSPKKASSKVPIEIYNVEDLSADEENFIAGLEKLESERYFKQKPSEIEKDYQDMLRGYEQVQKELANANKNAGMNSKAGPSPKDDEVPQAGPSPKEELTPKEIRDKAAIAAAEAKLRMPPVQSYETINTVEKLMMLRCWLSQGPMVQEMHAANEGLSDKFFTETLERLATQLWSIKDENGTPKFFKGKFAYFKIN